MKSRNKVLGLAAAAAFGLSLVLGGAGSAGAVGHCDDVWDSEVRSYEVTFSYEGEWVSDEGVTMYKYSGMVNGTWQNAYETNYQGSSMTLNIPC
ncbi:hypothetical protein LG634_30260 [Streptomyces bambusae]|uniref:hypothetical protein n=1 Tax=Streptomyces bambusae TaxID=1550616 RepID=UPI001CFFE4A4|nr:hypothetical protein [Streptomyces bambusae]MCB5169082.1 hypothetical protein [Streptomyces bambusae]